MSGPPPLPQRVPTLTEALWDARPGPGAAAPLSAGAITEQVLAELQARLEPQLAERVRAAMAPALERAVERLLHETRLEFGRSLRAEVALAVRQALDGHRPL